jgi:signal recognition particle receptor subunit beta
MALINYASREINCKLIYYGPGLGGKTTCLKYIYSKVDSKIRGKLISLATELDRTLFFDFLPMELGNVRGFNLRFHLYTVPGQIFYNASRRLILKGVDGLLFVADSQIERMDENLESVENLSQNLTAHGLVLSEIPLVLQYNKRDLPNIVSVEELEAALNPLGAPYYESVATEGVGVFESLKEAGKRVLRSLHQTHPQQRMAAG